MNLAAGDARGSTWAGCYRYLEQLSRGSGVDGNGRFRFSAERTTGQVTLRVLWEAKFHDNSLDFTRRITVLRGLNLLNTTRLTGTAQRISCNP